MSTAPRSGAAPARSSISRRRRCASGTPRVWMPTSATRVRSGFASMISCAIRDSVRRSASASRRTVPAGTSTALTVQPGSTVCGQPDSYDSFPASLDRLKGVRVVRDSKGFAGRSVGDPLTGLRNRCRAAPLSQESGSEDRLYPGHRFAAEGGVRALVSVAGIEVRIRIDRGRAILLLGRQVAVQEIVATPAVECVASERSDQKIVAVLTVER